uniref:LAGLIDADG homing endonuclease n=1 Tax=Romanomermis culicivorax TaxID=13658 RepID=A0A915JBQ4_ROMCU
MIQITMVPPLNSNWNFSYVASVQLTKNKAKTTTAASIINKLSIYKTLYYMFYKEDIEKMRGCLLKILEIPNTWIEFLTFWYIYRKIL